MLLHEVPLALLRNPDSTRAAQLSAGAGRECNHSDGMEMIFFVQSLQYPTDITVSKVKNILGWDKN